MCDDEKTMPIPNVGVCIAKIRDYMEKTQNCKSCNENSKEAQEALDYMSFVLTGNAVWDWERCNPRIPVLKG